GLGRLCAASCVTTHPGWRSEGGAVARALAAFPQFELGLHLNLTEGRPLTSDLSRHWVELPSLPRLIARAAVDALPLAAIATELRAQLDAFADAVGQAPSYLDGHQHVHHLPGVRAVVMAATTRARLAGAAAIRNTGDVGGPGSWLKRQAIEATGGRALLRRLRAEGVRHNATLLGVYDFADADYRSRFRAWLAAAPASGGLLHCHASAATAVAGDPIAAARTREAAYMLGSACGDDLAAAEVSLGPAW
ncbi:MAG: ChbG/HpnK family deacetylase, partial [Pseudomonadota bacterium]|nr:ChbG/HpnK family deacetylase [Pseudomonadota bacterium]